MTERWLCARLNWGQRRACATAAFAGIAARALIERSLGSFSISHLLGNEPPRSSTSVTDTRINRARELLRGVRSSISYSVCPSPTRSLPTPGTHEPWIDAPLGHSASEHPTLTHIVILVSFFTRRSQAPRASERLRPAARRSSASLSRRNRSWFFPLRGRPPRKQTLALGSRLPLAPFGWCALRDSGHQKEKFRCMTIR